MCYTERMYAKAEAEEKKELPERQFQACINACIPRETLPSLYQFRGSNLSGSTQSSQTA